LFKFSQNGFFLQSSPLLVPKSRPQHLLGFLSLKEASGFFPSTIDAAHGSCSQKQCPMAFMYTFPPTLPSLSFVFCCELSRDGDDSYDPPPILGSGTPISSLSLVLRLPSHGSILSSLFSAILHFSQLDFANELW